MRLPATGLSSTDPIRALTSSTNAASRGASASAFHDDALGAQLDSTQLTMLLGGMDVSHVRRPICPAGVVECRG